VHVQRPERLGAHFAAERQGAAQRGLGVAAIARQVFDPRAAVLDEKTLAQLGHGRPLFRRLGNAEQPARDAPFDF
jgi:hypothetical protein